MSISKEELEHTAQTYHQQDVLDDKHIEAACQAYTFEWVFGHIMPDDLVLEMGYGDGLFTEALHARNHQFEVVEGAASLVETISTKYPGVRAWHALFEEFAPEQKYDVVLCTHVLEHIIDPVALLSRMQGWLKPGGKLIIIVPNRDSLHRRLAVLMGLQVARDSLGARDRLVGHVRVYNFAGLISDAEAAGYAVLDQAGFFLKVLPNSMMLTYSEDLISAFNRISPDLPPELLANIGIVAGVRG
jgi:2-polyprenyl-3-methyl-5-hydroxy-6-metoxy-1,4-benzoquinol methylase